MIKQISITFDFNTETEEVSNIKTVGSTEKKARTTTKKVKDVVEKMANEALITLEPNKLIFNSKAVSDMEIEYEDRIVIKWEKEGKKMTPIIGKDIAFDEEGTGNKVTKSNSIAYKGKANTVLAELGTEFTIEPLREGVWKLLSTTGGINEDTSTLEEAIEQAEEVEPELLVDTDENNEIDELQFKL
jgi:hypothetical protein